MRTIDDLDTDYKCLARLCKTVEEEQRVFDEWVESGYNTELVLKRLAYMRKHRRYTSELHDVHEVVDDESCDPTDLVDGLTPRQAEIWRLRALDLTYEEIGLRMGCSERSIRREIDRLQVIARKYL